MSLFDVVRNRISQRLAVVMLPGLVVVLTLFGGATALREGEVIELEMQRDADDVALSLASMLESTSQDVDEARTVLGEVDRRLAHLEITLLELPPGTPIPPEWLAPVDELGRRRVVGAVEVGPRHPGAVVVVTEPLSERDAFVARALFTDAIGVAVAALVAWAFAVAVGHNLVERRVDRLIRRLAAVGRGEYPEEPLQLGTDELGVLGEAVDGMTTQLRAARDEAAAEVEARMRAQLHLRRADRLAAVGRTVAVFAHEVGNPLAVILGRAERLARHPDPVRHDADIVREQADRIATFVRRLLDYARHDDRFELVPVDLCEVVRRSLALVEDRAHAAEVSLVPALGDGPVPVLGSARALEQVVINLVSNALAASVQGQQVRVVVEVVSCGAGGPRGLPERHVHLVVADQGAGIPEDLRERVFDPFYTSREAGEGTGLGLPIVREIVQDHGGVVTIEDGPEGGCTMVVHLPPGGDHG